MLVRQKALRETARPKFGVRSLSVGALSVFAILVTLSLCYSTESWAQVGSAGEDDVVRVNTDLLVFPVRVRNKRGQAVTGLTERDLSLKDEDRVTTSLYFSAGADRLALVLALDQSGSLRDIISQQRDAALALFGRFSQKSRIAVLRFAAAPSLVAPFDRDPAAARAAFNFSARSNERTAIFDAAAAAVKAFEELPRYRSERRIVILISDGLDNASKTKAGAVINAARDNAVSFYVIHLPLFEPLDGRLAVRAPAKGFRELAEKTGGKYFLLGDATSALGPAKNEDLTPIFRAIEEDLRSQYLLGFYVGEPGRDGRRHRLSVRLVPQGTEFSIGQYGYSRTHDVFVNMPRGVVKTPN